MSCQMVLGQGLARWAQQLIQSGFPETRRGRRTVGLEGAGPGGGLGPFTAYPRGPVPSPWPLPASWAVRILSHSGRWQFGTRTKHSLGIWSPGFGISVSRRGVGPLSLTHSCFSGCHHPVEKKAERQKQREKEGLSDPPSPLLCFGGNSTHSSTLPGSVRFPRGQTGCSALRWLHGGFLFAGFPGPLWKPLFGGRRPSSARHRMGHDRRPGPSHPPGSAATLRPLTPSGSPWLGSLAAGTVGTVLLGCSDRVHVTVPGFQPGKVLRGPAGHKARLRGAVQQWGRALQDVCPPALALGQQGLLGSRSAQHPLRGREVWVPSPQV